MHADLSAAEEVVADRVAGLTEGALTRWSEERRSEKESSLLDMGCPIAELASVSLQTCPLPVACMTDSEKQSSWAPKRGVFAFS